MRKGLLISILFTLCFAVAVLSYCVIRHNNYRSTIIIETELGDELKISAGIEGVMAASGLRYTITGKGLSGIVFVNHSYINHMPSHPFESFKEIGRCGETNFYYFGGVLVFVHDNVIGGCTVNMDEPNLKGKLYDRKHYILDSKIDSENGSVIYQSVLEDILLIGNVDYAVQFGSILAVDENEKVRDLLYRYAASDFNVCELASFITSEKTKDQVVDWAVRELNEYYGLQ